MKLLRDTLKYTSSMCLGTKHLGIVHWLTWDSSLLCWTIGYFFLLQRCHSKYSQHHVTCSQPITRLFEWGIIKQHRARVGLEFHEGHYPHGEPK